MDTITFTTSRQNGKITMRSLVQSALIALATLLFIVAVQVAEAPRAKTGHVPEIFQALSLAHQSTEAVEAPLLY